VTLSWFSDSSFNLSGAPLGATDRMSVFAGGFEGAYALSERIGRRIHVGGTATPGDLTSKATPSVDSTPAGLNR
jgi:hypothetical protein